MIQEEGHVIQEEGHVIQEEVSLIHVSTMCPSPLQAHTYLVLRVLSRGEKNSSVPSSLPRSTNKDKRPLQDKIIIIHFLTQAIQLIPTYIPCQFINECFLHGEFLDHVHQYRRRHDITGGVMGRVPLQTHQDGPNQNLTKLPNTWGFPHTL